MKLSFFVYLGICIFDFGGGGLPLPPFSCSSLPQGPLFRRGFRRHLRAKSRRCAAVALRTPRGPSLGPSDQFTLSRLRAQCGRRVSFPAMGKKPMAQATLSCPFGAIHLEDRRGTAQDGHCVSIFAYPTPSVASRHLPLTGGVGPRSPDGHCVSIFAYPTPSVASRHLPLTGGVGPRSPVTRVTLWAGQNISGAQNLSSWSESPPGHWALSLQKFPPVRFHSRAWLCRANAPGPNPGGRMLCAPTGFRWTVWAAIRRPPWRFPSPRRGGPTWPPAGGETSLPLTPPSVPSPAPDPGTRSHGWRGPRTGPRR